MSALGSKGQKPNARPVRGRDITDVESGRIVWVVRLDGERSSSFDGIAMVDSSNV